MRFPNGAGSGGRAGAKAPKLLLAGREGDVDDHERSTSSTMNAIAIADPNGQFWAPRKLRR
jgi:hypothetical protein